MLKEIIIGLVAFYVTATLVAAMQYKHGQFHFEAFIPLLIGGGFYAGAICWQRLEKPKAAKK